MLRRTLLHEAYLPSRACQIVTGVNSFKTIY